MKVTENTTREEVEQYVKDVIRLRELYLAMADEALIFLNTFSVDGAMKEIEKMRNLRKEADLLVSGRKVTPSRRVIKV